MAAPRFIAVLKHGAPDGSSAAMTVPWLPASETRFVAWLAGLRHDRPAVPTYDYQCRACGLTTEVIHSMLESGPTVCEQCGGELRRVLYPAGIIFKGSGFYRTDSRPNGSTASSDAPKKTDPGSAGSSEKSGGTPAGETASPNKGDSSAT